MHLLMSTITLKPAHELTTFCLNDHNSSMKPTASWREWDLNDLDPFNQGLAGFPQVTLTGHS